MESKVVLAIYVHQIGLVNAYACVCVHVHACSENKHLFPRRRSRIHANVGTRRSALHSLETLASEARNRRAPLKHRKLMFLAVARTRRV